MKVLKKVLVFFTVLALAGAFSINAAFSKDYEEHYRYHPQKKVKNVIILVPDGCSQSILTLARWYKGEKLTVDGLHSGVVKHEMANSIITGSAAAATAFATGYKTTARFLSIGPREEDVLSTYDWPEDPSTFAYKPVASVMEGAKLKGKATGLISTSRFTHATPAAWACHSADRGNEGTDISETMVYNNIDLVFGGGERNLVPVSQGGKRSDEEDLRNVLTDRGYSIVRTQTEMDALTGLPVFGMFAWSHMDSEIDRPSYNPEEPSLADMTAKAIELLSQDRNGFILMVEGSQVDWAGHNNDPVWMVTDFIEFDEAVKVALDFAKQDGETLLLAYPDHNTGGMDIGNRSLNGGGSDYNGEVSSQGYTNLTVEELIDPIAGMTVTASSVANAIGGDTSDANMIAQIEALWGITIDAAECQEIRDMAEGDAGSLSYALARIISKNHTAIGWTSHGHNAEDVPMWSYGPGAPKGLVDNTELAEVVANALGLNMYKIQKRLFVNLEDMFSSLEMDETDPENPVARLSGKNVTAELPISKNILKITKKNVTKTYKLEGVVAAPMLLSPDLGSITTPESVKVYAPRKAVKIMKRHGIN